MTAVGVRQFYILPARQAISDLGIKLSSTRGLKYDGSFKVIGREFLAPLNSSVTFSGDFARTDSGTVMDSSFGGLWLSKDYTGDALVEDGKLYFRLAGDNLPVIRWNQSANTYNLTSDWHRATLDNNLYTWACETREDSTYPNGLDLIRFYRSLRINKSWLVGFSQPVAGHRTTHFSGRVEKQSLREALKTLDEKLPGSCQLPLFGQGAQDITARYDLWTSREYDRFRLKLEDPLLGVEAILQIDLHSYGDATEMNRPGPSVDLDALNPYALIKQ